jgi:hypothetical protein
MSEEQETAEGWSGVKKAIIGAITTAVTAGGAWFATHLGGGEEPKEEVKTEVSAPAPAPVVINVQQNQENKQQTKTSSAPTQIIRETVIEKHAPAAAPAKNKKEEDEDPW